MSACVRCKKWQCKSDRVILNSMIREGINNKLTLKQRLKEVKERAIHFSVGNRFQAEHIASAKVLSQEQSCPKEQSGGRYGLMASSRESYRR